MMVSTTEPPAVTTTSGLCSQADNSTFLDSEFRYVLLPVGYGIIFILGLLANLYVLYVLRCLREANTMGEIRIYMTNLTIADLLFVCALPFWIDYYSHQGHWRYSDPMCRLTGSLFFINTYCSILFLAAISVNRYWAVTRPLDAASSDHRLRGIIVCVVIWMVTLAMAIPYLVNKGTNDDINKNITRCFEGYQDDGDPEKKKLAATHFAIIGLFFVVFFLVVVCNFLIARALLFNSPPQSEFTTTMSRKSRTTSSSSKKPRGLKRKALQMLLAVVGVFVLCFLPHHVIQGPWTLSVLHITDGFGQVNWCQKTRQALNDAHQITLLLMGLNCILDPIVYCFATRKFRRFIVAHIKKIRGGDVCSQTVTSHVSMDSRNPSHRLQSEHQEPDGLI